MQSVQPLVTLLEHVSRERDAAQAAHQRLLAQARAAQAQSDQLVAYRGEYEQRFGAQFATSGAIELVRCYHGFMGRLEHAVRYQQDTASRVDAQLEAARTTLQQCELRVASVKKLIERRQAEAGLAEQRRDQKANDEFASRSAWQQRHGALTLNSSVC